MAVSNLRIGIEIEVLLEAREMQNQCAGDIETFSKNLVEYYNANISPGQTKMRTALDVYHASEDPMNHGYWSLAEEESIDPDDDHYWSVEFASPILQFRPESEWRQDVRRFFQIVERFAEIFTDISCGTHVHVSPGDGEWTVEQARNIARSVIYFEGAFEALLPFSRRGNHFCRSNRVDNPIFKQLPLLEDCFRRIDDCDTVLLLVFLMNAKGCCGTDMVIGDIDFPITERNYGFNFENLRPRGIGTIEFRRPPGVTTAEDCLMWVELGVSFMQAAAQHGTSLQDLQTYNTDVAGLTAFVQNAAVERANDLELLAKVLAQGSGFLEPFPLELKGQYEEIELERLATESSDIE